MHEKRCIAKLADVRPEAPSSSAKVQEKLPAFHHCVGMQCRPGEDKQVERAVCWHRRGDKAKHSGNAPAWESLQLWRVKGNESPEVRGWSLRGGYGTLGIWRM